MRALVWAVAGLPALSLLVTCSPAKTGLPGKSLSRATGRSVATTTPREKPPQGLDVELSEGQPSSATESSIPVARASRLDDERTNSLLSRLPPSPPREQASSFAQREGSLPPPRSAKRIEQAFPPPAEAVAPAAPAAGPLEIVRFSPDGEVSIAPQLSVTFSQAMVPVSSHAALSGREVPVKLTPQPPGTWRWVGTRTLLFEAGERLPMATEYKVEVPAGTRSATGGVLKKAARWRFGTPAPRIEHAFPEGGPRRTDTLLFLELDQHVDPQAVLDTVRVTAVRKRFAVRLATAAELRGDEEVRELAQRAQAGRWLPFRTLDPLPAAAKIQVTMGPGTPSLEGARTTTEPQSFELRTYEPLRIERHRCGAPQGKCPPHAPFMIELNNPLDQTAFSEALVRVSPELPGMRAEVSSNRLLIEGRSAARTTYEVTIAPGLRDEFGQSLGSEKRLRFAVGSWPPQLTAVRRGFVVLDPAAQGRYSVFSVNFSKLKVRLYAVEPRDWPAYFEYFEDVAYHRGGAKRMPGKLVHTEIIEVGGRPNEMVETPIDLSPALTGGSGQVIAVIEHVDPPPQGSSRAVIRSWIEVTRIGLTAFADNDSLLVWATALEDGKPLEGVELQLDGGSQTAVTDAGGLATLPLGGQGRDPKLLLARRAGETAMLPEAAKLWQVGRWGGHGEGETACWYVLDDRGIYRPGEEVHVKGWLRRVGTGKGGDVRGLGGGARRVRYKLVGPRGNELQKGERPLGALGGFDLRLKLPDTMNLGWAELELTAEGGDLGKVEHSHDFEVQEFRRPEVEVTVAASQGPHFVRRHVQLTARASYYAGGGLPGAEVRWAVFSEPGSFVPPNCGDFSFGAWQPWWTSWDDSGETRTATFVGRTDPLGKHVLDIALRSAQPPRPMSVHVEASVADVNRQEWAGEADLLVHPADCYVGLRTERPFVERGQPIDVQVIVVDLDGKAVRDRAVELEAVRLRWVREGGDWKEKEEEPQRCDLTSTDEPVSCRFQAPEGGRYRVRAVARDAEGRPNQSDLEVWVTGGKLLPARDVEEEKVTLVPDREEYRPGDTARLLVQAPFFPAEGLLTLRRSGIVDSRRFTMQGPTTTLEIPISEAYFPNVHAQVDLVGSAPRLDDDGRVSPDLPPRPAFAAGRVSLRVPPLARALTVEARPRETELEPGGSTTIDLRLKDASGKPVAGGEVAVVVVDEAILSLAGYELFDPLQVFYSERATGTWDRHLLSSILLARPGDLPLPATRADEGMGLQEIVVTGARRIPSMAPPKQETSAVAGQAPAIRTRADFNPLALFAPEIVTDDHGEARVEVELPDNLTRYRVMAVAVAGGNRFGAAESTITARLPLMVRPSPPRFLNYGDRFELSVVVQNQTAQPLRVDVAVRATNAEVTRGAGRRVSVPAHNRVEVLFPAAAALPGTARFQVAAAGGTWADAASVELPVWTPATTEAFATYGEIDDGAVVQPLEAPGDVLPEAGGVTVSTSSTALQALTDAVLYLVDYPFECAEQVSSRLMAIAALRNVLAAFRAGGLPPPEEMLAAAERDMARLKGMQNRDGGFALWRRGEESRPFVSVHATYALWLARENGLAVPDEVLARARRYLDDIDHHVASWPSAYARRIVVAYALAVLHRMGHDEPARARRLIAEAGLDGLALEAIGWILPVLAGDSGSARQVAAIRKLVGNRVTETAGAAAFVTSADDGDYLTLRSSRRADAVILEALLETQPDSDLVPKLVRGLLAHRKQGRWASTQENVFVLLALGAYFARFESQAPDFVARAWLGERFAGEHRFAGRAVEQQEIHVPMRMVVAGGGRHDLLLQKDGAGRMYYRVGMRYVPRSLKLEAADHGFTVERLYEAVDDSRDVRRDADGVWHVRAGARVRVRLQLVAPARRYHVALVDPLPAGLEPLNPTLKVTGEIPRAVGDEQRGARWRRPWYEHENMRDERVEAFASLLWDGVHAYSYVARATTPGVFVVPPARAEEMYSPETFGRCGTDTMIVE